MLLEIFRGFLVGVIGLCLVYLFCEIVNSFFSEFGDDA